MLHLLHCAIITLISRCLVYERSVIVNIKQGFAWIVLKSSLEL